MKTKKRKPSLYRIAWTAAILVSSGMLSAQTVLDAYIEEGLKSNLVLQEKNLSWQQAQQSLQMAKSYFLPSVNLLADYTSGQGGGVLPSLSATFLIRYTPRSIKSHRAMLFHKLRMQNRISFQRTSTMQGSGPLCRLSTRIFI